MKFESTHLAAEPLSARSILKKICVSPPYFALSDFKLFNNNLLQAKFNIENLAYSESFIISSGEAGRHLAILGACALSLQNPSDDRYFYLATHAVGNNEAGEPWIYEKPIGRKATFTAKAIVLSIDVCKKVGMADTWLFAEDGTPVSRLRVTYQVLSCRLFEKLFSKGYNINAIATHHNPYAGIIALNDSKLANNILSGQTGVIKPEQCAGHFENYPALPVAFLCSALFEFAGMHYRKVLNIDDVKFCVKDIDLTAARLALAGEFLFFNSFQLNKEQCNNHFQVRATDYLGNNVGKLDVRLRAIE